MLIIYYIISSDEIDIKTVYVANLLIYLAKCRSNSPVPRLSFAHRFDTKLREMSFEKQNSAKAVLFTMYVSTAGAKTFYHRKT